MTEENIDPDQEFSIQDSTEEFETQDETSDTYEPSEVDFDQASAVVDQPNDASEEPEGTEYTDSSIGSEDLQGIDTGAQISEPEQKTPSPQSFRVMRFEDFLNQPAN